MSRSTRTPQSSTVCPCVPTTKPDDGHAYVRTYAVYPSVHGYLYRYVYQVPVVWYRGTPPGVSTAQSHDRITVRSTSKYAQVLYRYSTIRYRTGTGTRWYKYPAYPRVQYFLFSSKKKILHILLSNESSIDKAKTSLRSSPLYPYYYSS